MSVVPLSPVRDRTDEVREAVRNDGGTLHQWAKMEVLWFAAAFLKIAASVVFTRYVYKIFETEVVSKSIFDRANDLMRFGRRPRPFTVPPGAAPPPGSGYPGGGASPSPSSSSSSDTAAAAAASSYSSAPDFRSNGTDRARVVKQFGEHVLAHHNTKIRDDHFWPCPITNHREGCVDCGLFVIRNRVAMCAAVEKLKQILEGHDDGSDLYEMRERLERG